jgi:hypothetical protein
VEGGFGLPYKIEGADGEPINVGNASAPCVVDWDSDGDLDLIVGEISGTVSFVENTGSDRVPKYAEPMQIKSEGMFISVAGGDAGPVVTDWDSDGDLDLLVGTGDGGVDLYQNRRQILRGDMEGKISYGEPLLGPRVELVNGRSYKKNEETGEYGLEPAGGLHPDEMGSRAKLSVCDWNADGALDLLVGDFSSEMGPEPVLTEEQVATKERLEAERSEYSEKMNLQWKKIRDAAAEAIGEKRADESQEDYHDRLFEKQEELQDADVDYKEVNQRFQEIYSDLAPLRPASIYHGYVWVYLRKPRS